MVDPELAEATSITEPFYCHQKYTFIGAVFILRLPSLSASYG